MNVWNGMSLQLLINGSKTESKEKLEVMQNKQCHLFFFPCPFHTFLKILFLNMSFLFLRSSFYIWGKFWNVENDKKKDFSHVVLLIACRYQDNSGFCQTLPGSFQLYKITRIIPTYSVWSGQSLFLSLLYQNVKPEGRLFCESAALHQCSV